MRGRLRERMGRQTDDVWGLGLIVVSFLIVLSFFSLAGPVGGATGKVLHFLFGTWAALVPLVLAIIGAALLGPMPRPDYVKLAIGLGVAFVGSLALFHLMTGTLSLAQSIDSVTTRGGVVAHSSLFR